MYMIPSNQQQKQLWPDNRGGGKLTRRGHAEERIRTRNKRNTKDPYRQRAILRDIVLAE